MSEPTAILVLTGQTASGKERLALAVARRLGSVPARRDCAGEIVSADSMKVYRGMDVGTAKASPEDRRAVPHHLVDVAEVSPGPNPDKIGTGGAGAPGFSTARWVELADAAVADIAARGHVPIISGGTMLYLKALLEGLFEGPAADEELRARLSAEAEAQGTAALHARLAQVDPDAAGRIHPNDLRRIIRALEVWELAGAPISALQTQWGARRGRYRPLLVAVRRSPEDLDRRIAERVRRMVEAGLEDEVRRLSARPGGMALGPRQALGYAEMLEHLAGRLSCEEAVEEIVLHTRQFARAQMKWLKRLEGLVWLDAAPDTSTDALAEQVVALWRAHVGSTAG